MNKNKAIVLFSGGTDSTLTSALLTKDFDEIHLITYNRFGFHAAENTETQANMLKEKYGQDKFVHRLINVDDLFKHVSYENYLYNIKKFGFFNLSTCGLCKLSMHIKTIDYALENGIKTVADGANKAMSMFPSQMEPVIQEMKKLYQGFGIDYINPVFEMEGPSDGNFIDKHSIRTYDINTDQTISEAEFNGKLEDQSPGYKLHQLGLAPKSNVKGTEYDRKRQPRCFQFITFNIFAKKYFLATKSYEEYRDQTVEFYKDKISRLKHLLENREEAKNKKILGSNE